MHATLVSSKCVPRTDTYDLSDAGRSAERHSCAGCCGMFADCMVQGAGPASSPLQVSPQCSLTACGLELVVCHDQTHVATPTLYAAVVLLPDGDPSDWCQLGHASDREWSAGASTDTAH